MVHYIPNDYYSYPTPPLSQEFDAVPSQDQTPDAEELERQAYELIATFWGAGAQQGPVADSWADVCATTNHEPVAPATSYVAGSEGWPQASYTNPLDSEQQSQLIDAAQEPYTETYGPSSAPLNCLGNNTSGFSTTFGWVDAEVGSFVQDSVGILPQSNMGSSYHYNSDPTRAGPIPTGQFQPHGTSSAQANGHRNVEAGSSAIVHPPAPNVGLPTSQPPGWLPETTADAVNNQTFTEGEEAQVPERTRAGYSEGGPPRPRRARRVRDTYRLRDWIRRWMGLPHFPTTNEALTIVVDVIPTIRPAVYQHPCLEGNGSVAAEGMRLGRTVFEEISQYYLLEPGMEKWRAPLLLKKVLEDLDSYPLFEPFS